MTAWFSWRELDPSGIRGGGGVALIVSMERAALHDVWSWSLDSFVAVKMEMHMGKTDALSKGAVAVAEVAGT